jgi:ABC-2 type transport system permease protein
MRPLFYELYKLFARRRSLIGFLAFVVLEFVVLLVLQTEPSQKAFRQGFAQAGLPAQMMFEHYFSATTLGLIVMAASSFLLASLFLCLVGGDIVAKEAEDGVLRMVLARPIGRLRLLLIKYLSCVLYTLMLGIFIGISSWILGIVLRGWGGALFVFLPERGIFALHEGSEALVRYGLATVALSLSLITVTSVAFFFSCLPIKPAAATILALTYLFMEFILDKIPFFEAYRPYLSVTYTSTWVNTLVKDIPWDEMARDYAILGGINLGLFTMGYLIFRRRDFKS